MYSTLIILVVKSLDIHDFTIFETILCIMPRIFLVKPKSFDQHSFIIICIVPFSGKAISFYKRSKHYQRLNLRYFFRWLFNSGLDMVCSRIQWIAKIFRFFNNFSLFWTVRSLDISPLMRFVPFLSGSFASKFCLKMFELCSSIVQTVCNTLPHFVDQHQEFLKICISSKSVKYVKRRTGQKMYKMHYCAQWWTHHRDLEVASKEQFQTSLNKFGQDFYFLNNL